MPKKITYNKMKEFINPMPGKDSSPNQETESKKIGSLAEFDMDYFKSIIGERDWIAIGMENCKNQQYYTVLSTTGEKLGIIGVYDTDDDQNIVHYVTDPRHRGHGLAGKFVVRITSELNLPYTTLTIDLGNAPSISAAEKIPGIKKTSDERYEEEFHKVKYVYENKPLNKVE